MKDIVYIVKPQDDNEELRYSLRSICRHYKHGTVHMAGYMPSWVTGCNHIDVEQGRDKWANSRANLLAACQSDDVSDTFILMCDDFFFLRDVDEVHVQHRGLVSDRIRRMKRKGPLGIYHRGMVETNRITRQLCDEPVSYELHKPMPIDRSKMLEAYRLPEEYGIKPRVLHIQTLYGNFAGIGGRQARDNKVASTTKPLDMSRTYVSTDDGSFARGVVGRQIRELFPDRCRYER